MLGLAIGEIRPPWWNMSNLSTGVRIFLSQPEPDIARQLLSAASAWFDARQAHNWTILVSPYDAATNLAVNQCGTVSIKQYYRITVPSVISGSILDYYNSFAKRRERNSAPIAVISLSL
ncbi:MAG TPA: hypothetical protein VK308_14300 [Pyrinomonadaceae bacterium]|nr:hypothetical protein [Pyrinomonadaceae bacterium]